MGSSLSLYSTGTTGGGRVLVGFVVAPAVSSVVAVAVTVACFLMQIPGEAPGGAAQAVAGGLFLTGWMVIAFGAPVAYIGMALVGFPTWLLLHLTRNESAIAYTLAGAAGGWCLAPAMAGHKWAGFPMGIVGMFAGALTLWLFWRMAKREAGWP
jgi:hypothetical protein